MCGVSLIEVYLGCNFMQACFRIVNSVNGKSVHSMAERLERESFGSPPAVDRNQIEPEVNHSNVRVGAWST